MPQTKYYLSDYDITEEGLVINKHTGRILKPQPNGKGYLRIGVQTENGKKYLFVHRLVAQKYVPNPENKSQVNHIDGNKRNNRADNLEWTTNKENRKHAVKTGLQIQGEKCPWAKLDSKAVEFIRSNQNYTRNELAEMFGVSPHTISDIRLKRSWKNG